jgi:hypothetical protein
MWHGREDKIEGMRTIGRYVSFAFQLLRSHLDNLFSKSRSQIISINNQDLSKKFQRLLIYVHFSNDLTVQPWEIDSMKRLRELGFQVCFVMNLSKSQLDKIPSYSDSYNSFSDVQIYRRNIGLDLAAYRDTVEDMKEQIDFKSLDAVYFMNNSCIWDSSRMAEQYRRMISTKFDVCASVISNQFVPHIQTYLFGANTAEGIAEICRWLSKVKNWRYKKSVVLFGELGTNQIIKSSISVGALVSEDKLLESANEKCLENYKLGINNTSGTLSRLIENRQLAFAGIPVNPSHNYWLEIYELGFPGIKMDLLRSNPLNLPDYDLAVSTALEYGMSGEYLAKSILRNPTKYISIRIRKKLKL